MKVYILQGYLKNKTGHIVSIATCGFSFTEIKDAEARVKELNRHNNFDCFYKYEILETSLTNVEIFMNG